MPILEIGGHIYLTKGILLLSLFIESCKFENHTEAITTMPVLMFTLYFYEVACNIIGMGNCCYILYGRFCKNLMNEMCNGSHVFYANILISNSV